MEGSKGVTPEKYSLAKLQYLPRVGGSIGNGGGGDWREAESLSRGDGGDEHVEEQLTDNWGSELSVLWPMLAAEASVEAEGPVVADPEAMSLTVLA
nr:hypothetical protein Iba_chr12aCG6290 [Ipomoea batatas]